MGYIRLEQNLGNHEEKWKACLNMDEVFSISPEDVYFITSEYSEELTEHFSQMPKVANPLIKEAKAAFVKIEQMLYSVPAFIDAVKAAVPDVTLQAILTNEQKQQIAKGALKLMTKKDGSLMASLINPETTKIIKNIPLKFVKMAPEMTQAITSFSTQMQLAQIAEQIQAVQLAVDEVHQGQEYDRLATAFSCQQKLLQAMEIRNPELRSIALLRLTSDAEDSRNLLMLSQKANVGFINDQPESDFGKIISGATPKKINSRMNEIRQNLCAVNMVSLTEAIAYQEMGENEAARKSLTYYAEFIYDTYLAVPSLVERLDMIDPSPEKYWSKTLPEIKKRIDALPYIEEIKLIGDTEDEED